MSFFRQRFLPATLVATGALISLGAQAAAPTFDDLAHPDLYKVVSRDTTDTWVSNGSFSSGTQLSNPVASHLGLEGSHQFDNVTAGSVTTPIPEPQTYALMLAGIGVLSMVALRRRRVD